MRVLVRSVVCVVAALTACNGGSAHNTFASEKTLLVALGSPAIMGRFNVELPARIVRIESPDGDLEFEHAGTQHVYRKPDGIAVRAVFLEHAHGKGVLVVSSSES